MAFSASAYVTRLIESIQALSPSAQIALAVFVVIGLSWLYNALTRYKDAPPYVPTWVPWFGAIFMFAKSPIDLINYGRSLYGDIFSMKVLGRDMTVLTGPDAHSAFFRATDSTLSQKEVYQFTAPVFGKDVVYDAPIDIFHQQLGVAKAALLTEKMATYCPLIIDEVDKFVAKWGDEGEIDLLDALSEITVCTASRCLLGAEIRETLKDSGKFADLYHDLEAALNPVGFFLPNLPLPGMKRRDDARKKMQELFTSVIKARRASGETHADVLDALIHAHYKDGTPYPDEHIMGIMIAMLFAGQHTSSITGTWMGLLLMNNNSDGHIDRLLDEQRSVMRQTGGLLNFDAVSNMPALERVVQETVRLFPPLIMLMRYVRRPVTYGGYTIPEGHMVAVSPAVSHRLPEAFDNADGFDPERFTPEREKEISKQYSFIGFGAGRHHCLGEKFAKLQLKLIWSTLLRRFEWELVSPMPEPDYQQLVVGPKKPCMVRFKRRKSEIGM